MTTPDAIEIRHLRTFLVIAETENFTRAAQRLRITQPGVSQQMAQLELVLGTPLFRRVGKRVQLTEAGVAFRRHAEVVLRKLDEARASVHEVAGLLTGHIEIGVIPVLLVAWLPQVLARLARDHPELTVGVQQRASSDVETEIESGRLDLGFGLMTRRSPAIRYEPLHSEPFSLLVPPRSRFASRRSLDPGDLHGERLVLLPSSFDMRRLADELFRRARVRPRVVFEINNIETVLRTVRQTGIPSVLPSMVLRGRKAALGLRAIPLTGKGRPLEFGLLWPAGHAASPAALVLAVALKATWRAGTTPRRAAPGRGKAPR